jgi:hypothetical protein
MDQKPIIKLRVLSRRNLRHKQNKKKQKRKTRKEVERVKRIQRDKQLPCFFDPRQAKKRVS